MYNARSMSPNRKSPRRPSLRFSRRQVLGAAAAVGASAFLLRGESTPRVSAKAAEGNHHLAWVWQFSTDAEPDVIGAKLREHAMGVIVKTHDGVTWMSEYDTSDYAVSGPDQVQLLTKFFEDAGVPFHAWCVVHGSDPVKEAQMAAAVYHAGARSLWLDVEPHEGFWEGTEKDAIKYGDELRRLTPDANIILSLDPRPWMLEQLPLTAFTSFSNAIAPQNYWRTFDTQANYDKFREAGFPVPNEKLTPEFLLALSNGLLSPYGLPQVQVGSGDTKDGDEWVRYIDGAYAGSADFVTVWRYGITENAVFNVLTEKPPKQPPVAPSLASYIVQPGDSLGLIAANYGVTVEDIMNENGLADPDYIYVGQELIIP